MHGHKKNNGGGTRTIPVNEAVGTVIAHDITEIRPGEFKDAAFKKGHIVKQEDISLLKKIGKENLFILEIREDEMHENDAAVALAEALSGTGISWNKEPKEGKINLFAEKDGLFRANRDVLLKFNMLGEVACSTIHGNSVVQSGQLVAGTRAIPLVVKRSVVDEAVKIAGTVKGVLTVSDMRKPAAGVVITGNEVYHKRVKDAFAPVIKRKIKAVDGVIVGLHYVPDEVGQIEDMIKELIADGADLIIITGGMSVDPDDVTRYAISNLCSGDTTYGSPVLPGSMFLVAYMEMKNPKSEIRNPKLKHVPILGIPACGMYSSITVFDLILPRVLAGERIGRKELAELGHGGLCLKCKECTYPVCPFGK
ncbi:MAG TPA: molybdopterin-binding protein [Nitrospirae bacterium]|nr:molybdopterin-binding protein [Nitrospirota bacterium]